MATTLFDSSERVSCKKAPFPTEASAAAGRRLGTVIFRCAVCDAWHIAAAPSEKPTCPNTACDGEGLAVYTWDDDLGIRHVDSFDCPDCTAAAPSEETT